MNPERMGGNPRTTGAPTDHPSPAKIRIMAGQPLADPHPRLPRPDETTGLVGDALLACGGEVLDGPLHVPFDGLVEGFSVTGLKQVQ